MMSALDDSSTNPLSSASLHSMSTSTMADCSVEDKTRFQRSLSCNSSNLSLPSSEPSLLDQFRTASKQNDVKNLYLEPKRPPQVNLRRPFTFKKKQRKENSIDFTLREETASSIDTSTASVNLSHLNAPALKRPTKKAAFKFDMSATECESINNSDMSLESSKSRPAFLGKMRSKGVLEPVDFSLTGIADDPDASVHLETKDSTFTIKSGPSGLGQRKSNRKNVPIDFTLNINSDASDNSVLSEVDIVKNDTFTIEPGVSGVPLQRFNREKRSVDFSMNMTLGVDAVESPARVRDFVDVGDVLEARAATPLPENSHRSLLGITSEEDRSCLSLAISPEKGDDIDVLPSPRLSRTPLDHIKWPQSEKENSLDSSEKKNTPLNSTKINSHSKFKERLSMKPKSAVISDVGSAHEKSVTVTVRGDGSKPIDADPEECAALSRSSVSDIPQPLPFNSPPAEPMPVDNCTFTVGDNEETPSKEINQSVIVSENPLLERKARKDIEVDFTLHEKMSNDSDTSDIISLAGEKSNLRRPQRKAMSIKFDTSETRSDPDTANKRNFGRSDVETATPQKSIEISRALNVSTSTDHPVVEIKEPLRRSRRTRGVASLDFTLSQTSSDNISRVSEATSTQKKTIDPLQERRSKRQKFSVPFSFTDSTLKQQSQNELQTPVVGKGEIIPHDPDENIEDPATSVEVQGSEPFRRRKQAKRHISLEFTLCKTPSGEGTSALENCANHLRNEHGTEKEISDPDASSSLEVMADGLGDETVDEFRKTYEMKHGDACQHPAARPDPLVEPKEKICQPDSQVTELDVSAKNSQEDVSVEDNSVARVQHTDQDPEVEADQKIRSATIPEVHLVLLTAEPKIEESQLMATTEEPTLTATTVVPQTNEYKHITTTSVPQTDEPQHTAITTVPQADEPQLMEATTEPEIQELSLFISTAESNLSMTSAEPEIQELSLFLTTSESHLSMTTAEPEIQETSLIVTTAESQIQEPQLMATTAEPIIQEPAPVVTTAESRIQKPQLMATTTQSQIQEPQLVATTAEPITQEPPHVVTTAVSQIQEPQLMATTAESKIQEPQLVATTAEPIIQEPSHVVITAESQIQESQLMTTAEPEIHETSLIVTTAESQIQEPQLMGTTAEPIIQEPSPVVFTAESQSQEPQLMATTAEPIIQEPSPVFTTAESQIQEPQLMTTTTSEPVIHEPSCVVTTAVSQIQEPQLMGTTGEPIIQEPSPVVTTTESRIQEPQPMTTTAEPIIQEPLPVVTTAESQIQEPQFMTTTAEPIIQEPSCVVTTAESQILALQPMLPTRYHLNQEPLMVTTTAVSNVISPMVKIPADDLKVASVVQKGCNDEKQNDETSSPVTAATLAKQSFQSTRDPQLISQPLSLEPQIILPGSVPLPVIPEIENFPTLAKRVSAPEPPTTPIRNIRIPKRKSVTFKHPSENLYHSPPEYPMPHENDQERVVLALRSQNINDTSRIHMTVDLSEIESAGVTTRSNKRASSTPLPKTKKRHFVNAFTVGEEYDAVIRREATREVQDVDRNLMPPPPVLADDDCDIAAPIAQKGAELVDMCPKDDKSPLRPVPVVKPSIRKRSSESETSSVDLSCENSLNISAIPKEASGPKWLNVYHSTPLRKMKSYNERKFKKRGNRVSTQNNVEDERIDCEEPKAINHSVQTSRVLRSRSKVSSISESSVASSSRERGEPSRRNETRTSKGEPPEQIEDNYSPQRRATNDTTILSTRMSSLTRKNSRSRLAFSYASYDSHRKLVDLFQDEDAEEVTAQTAKVASDNPVDIPLYDANDGPDDGSSEAARGQDAGASEVSSRHDEEPEEGNDVMSDIGSVDGGNSDLESVSSIRSLPESIHSSASTSKQSQFSTNSLCSQNRSVFNGACGKCDLCGCSNKARSLTKFSSKPQKSDYSLFFEKPKRKKHPAPINEDEAWARNRPKFFKPKWSTKLYKWLGPKIDSTSTIESLVIELDCAFKYASSGSCDVATNRIIDRVKAIGIVTNQLEFWSFIQRFTPHSFQLAVLPMGGAFGTPSSSRINPYDPI